MGFFYSLLQLYNNSNIRTYDLIYNKFTPCPLTEECVNRTAFHKDFAVIKNKRQVMYLTKKYYTDSNGQSMLYPFKDIVIPLVPKYHVNKGFPLLHRIDNFLLLFHSNGLISKWERDIAGLSKTAPITSKKNKLTMGHLQSAFYILILGCLIATLVFIVELIYSKK